MVLIEGGRPQVGHQQRHALAQALLGGMLHQVLGLGGKAHTVGGVVPAGDGGEDVGVLHQRNRGHAGRRCAFRFWQGRRVGAVSHGGVRCDERRLGGWLLDLLRGFLGRSPVGHGGHGDEAVDADGGGRQIQFGCDGIQHLPGALNADEAHACRSRQLGGAADQRHGGAGAAAGLGQGIAHLAGGLIGDAAHRVDGLVGGAGREQDALALQPLGREEGVQLLDQVQRLQHAASAHFAAGLLTGVGAQHADAVGAQLVDVALGGRVLPHLPVHGRGHQQRDVPCHTQRGEQVVAVPMGQLRDEICRGGGHQDRIGLTAQLDVRHVVVDAGIEGIGVDRVARQRLEGDGPDETGGGLGHHHLHLGAGTAQIAHQLGGLVGGHAAGHAQHQASASQRGRRQALVIRGGGRPGVVGGGGRVGGCVHGGHGRGLPAVPGSTVEADSSEREALPEREGRSAPVA